VLTWHHDTHHQGYVNGLQAAEETLAENRSSGDFGGSAGALGNVTHNGCGHYLHTLFWENMSPNGGGEPSGDLADRIAEDFWLLRGLEGRVRGRRRRRRWLGAAGLRPRRETAAQRRGRQARPGALWGSHPILALDVWEHSYYYDYGPDRGSFIDAFFDVVDWEKATEEYEKCLGHFGIER